MLGIEHKRIKLNEWKTEYMAGMVIEWRGISDARMNESNGKKGVLSHWHEEKRWPHDVNVTLQQRQKTSRYEYEKSLAPGVNDFELERILASRGSDFRTLLNRHDVHQSNLERLSTALRLFEGTGKPAQTCMSVQFASMSVQCFCACQLDTIYPRLECCWKVNNEFVIPWFTQQAGYFLHGGGECRLKPRSDRRIRRHIQRRWWWNLLNGCEQSGWSWQTRHRH